MNLLNAQRLACYWDTTEKTFQSGRKKALNLHCFCFDMLDTLDLKTSYYEESDNGQTIIAKKTPTKSMNSLQKQSGIHQR